MQLNSELFSFLLGLLTTLVDRFDKAAETRKADSARWKERSRSFHERLSISFTQAARLIQLNPKESEAFTTLLKDQVLLSDLIDLILASQCSPDSFVRRFVESSPALAPTEESLRLVFKSVLDVIYATIAADPELAAYVQLKKLTF